MRKAAVIIATLAALIVVSLLIVKRDVLPYAPQQPILFSHKAHAGDNQIPCLYCHSYATKSPVAGVQSVQKCMGCHTIITGTTKDTINGSTYQEEIKKLRDYWERKEPIPWIRVHKLPEHAHFNHKRHILYKKDEIKCQTCHGEVEKMDVVERVSSLQMGWCITCHKEKEASRDCLTCHH